jgi:hypothetical protein
MLCVCVYRVCVVCVVCRVAYLRRWWRRGGARRGWRAGSGASPRPRRTGGAAARPARSPGWPPPPPSHTAAGHPHKRVSRACGRPARTRTHESARTCSAAVRAAKAVAWTSSLAVPVEMWMRRPVCCAHCCRSVSAVGGAQASVSTSAAATVSECAAPISSRVAASSPILAARSSALCQNTAHAPSHARTHAHDTTRAVSEGSALSRASERGSDVPGASLTLLAAVRRFLAAGRRWRVAAAMGALVPG